MPTAEITIASMRTADEAAAFGRLNEAWISEIFVLEEEDRVMLGDPFAAFVAKGGDVLIARAHDRVIGCAALAPGGHGLFVLSKMAVDARERGRGAGRLLMEAAIARARALGATSLFLASNHRLTTALGLYESVGFVHVPPDATRPMPYTRADVFMSLDLTDSRP